MSNHSYDRSHIEDFLPKLDFVGRKAYEDSNSTLYQPRDINPNELEFVDTALYKWYKKWDWRFDNSANLSKDIELRDFHGQWVDHRNPRNPKFYTVTELERCLWVLKYGDNPDVFDWKRDSYKRRMGGN